MENNRIEGNSSLLTQTLRINGQAITVQDVARRYLKWKAAAYRNTLLTIIAVALLQFTVYWFSFTPHSARHEPANPRCVPEYAAVSGACA